MFRNPEFLRNIWLELSQHRLMGMPAILSAIFFLVFLSTEPYYADPINTTALILYFVLTLLWGTRLAGDALINEIRDRTWDQQRMTSISPWSMAWGKLFGSTIVVWYGAGLCLLVYVITANFENGIGVLKDLLLMLSIGVLAHGVAMLSSLLSIGKKRNLNRSASNSFMILGILLAFPFIKVSLYSDFQIAWFDYHIHSKDFFLLSLLSFCAWLLIAIYRKMRGELQFRSYPIVWICFLAFFTLYITGLVSIAFTDPQQIYSARLFVAFVSLVGLTYLMIFMESKDPILIRRMVIAIKQREWHRIFEHIPNWLVTLIAVYIVCPLLILADSGQHNILEITRDWAFEFNSTLIAVSLFLSRDILIILFLNFSKNRKRADLTALIYLAILYWLIPSLLGAMSLISLLPAFLPVSLGNSSLSILSGLLQSGLLIVLLVNRYRKF